MPFAVCCCVIISVAGVAIVAVAIGVGAARTIGDTVVGVGGYGVDDVVVYCYNAVGCDVGGLLRHCCCDYCCWCLEALRLLSVFCEWLIVLLLLVLGLLFGGYAVVWLVLNLVC